MSLNAHPSVCQCVTVKPFQCCSYSSDDSGEECTQAEKRRRVQEEEVSSPTPDSDDFLKAFPVGITGQPPNKTQRAKAGFPTDRVFYDKWRALQYSKREQHLLCKCRCFLSQ